MEDNFHQDYWSSFRNKSGNIKREKLWRDYVKDVYQVLFDKWLSGFNKGITLKTDLYDESLTTYNLIHLLNDRCEHIIGTDVSFHIAASAQKRLLTKHRNWRNAVVSDIRKTALKTDSLDQIISNSTLDHFLIKEDIIISLKELHRILKTGGTLIITLDNPTNPMVFLRNSASYRFLKFIKVIPFYMGATLSSKELIRIMKTIGFKIDNSSSIIHAPRILAMLAGYVIDKTGNDKLKLYFKRILKIFERLERSPIKYFTGYFIAVKAVKI